jgi:hypothetical protein
VGFSFLDLICLAKAAILCSVKITKKHFLFCLPFLAPAGWFAAHGNIPMTVFCLGALNAFINISYHRH